MNAGSAAPDDPRPPDPSELAPLRFVVEGEARRVLSDAQVAPDPRRVAEGWERRFIADETRAAEMMRLYQELGFETAADPIRSEDVGDDCGDCRLVAALRFKMIYTRRGPSIERGLRPQEDCP